MLIVITPTGGRPEAIKNLNFYLERQTEQDFYWIVLDDCNPRGNKQPRCDLLINPNWSCEGENTQSRSLHRLLQECNVSDKVIICEDDDYYSSDYVKTMSEKLDYFDLVGEKDTIYYNVSNNTHRKFINNNHASLCQTAFTALRVNDFKKICGTQKKHLDCTLWKKGGHLFQSQNCIGIKGMPGRKGIGVGHNMTGMSDPLRVYFKNLIGEDVKRYD